MSEIVNVISFNLYLIKILDKSIKIMCENYGPYSETWYKKGRIRSQYKLIPGITKPASYF